MFDRLAASSNTMLDEQCDAWGGSNKETIK